MELGHAGSGFDPGATTAARSHADFDGIHAELGEKARAVERGDVPADERRVRKPGADALDAFAHDIGMSVSDVDDEDVDLSVHESGGSFEEVTAGADGSSDEQTSFAVLV